MLRRWILGLMVVVSSAPLRAAEVTSVGPRITLDATGLSLKDAVLRLGQALNRRINFDWGQDPRLTRTVDLHFRDATPRDVADWCETALDMTLQRADHGSYYLHAARAESQRLARVAADAWRVDLARIDYSYSALLVPGSTQPPQLGQALQVRWQLLPPGDAERLGLVDVGVLATRFSDGSELAAGALTPVIAGQEGAVGVSYELPVPAQEGLRLAQTGLHLTFCDLHELLFNFDLPAAAAQPAATAPLETRSQGNVELTLVRRSERGVRLTARRSGAVEPEPATNAQRILRDYYRTWPVEARLVGLDGTPLLTACQVEFQNRSAAGAGVRDTWALRVLPSGADAEKPFGHLELRWYERGTTLHTVDVRADNLPLPPTRRDD